MLDAQEALRAYRMMKVSSPYLLVSFLDADSNGVLSRLEFSRAGAFNYSKDMRSKLVGLLDTNGDQFIDAREWGYVKVHSLQIRWTPEMDMAGNARTFVAELLRRGSCEYAQVRYSVDKCFYCISSSDSLQSLAYRHQTDWTQIWSSNRQLLSPDELLVGQRIRLGNLYLSQVGDTWTRLSSRFGMNMTTLQGLNPDLIPDLLNLSPLAAGSLVCLMPDTAGARRHSVDTILL